MEPRATLVLILLAIIPVVVFAVSEGAAFVYLAVVNVVIVAASLYLMFGPPDLELDSVLPG